MKKKKFFARFCPFLRREKRKKKSVREKKFSGRTEGIAANARIFGKVQLTKYCIVNIEADGASKERRKGHGTGSKYFDKQSLL